jgi:hypothetical protein
MPKALIITYDFALLAFSRDSTLLVIAPTTYRDVIRVWDTKTGQQRYALDLSATIPRQLALSYDSKFLAITVESGIDVWSLESEKIVRSVPYASERNDIFFDNSMLCMATDLGYVGLEGLDSERLGSEGSQNLVPLQPITTKLLNERYTTNEDSNFSVIYWNTKKLIWLPSEYRQHSKLKVAFASSSSVIKISTAARGILTIEFHRPRPVESEDWTPWRSPPLFREISDDSN